MNLLFRAACIDYITWPGSVDTVLPEGDKYAFTQWAQTKGACLVEANSSAAMLYTIGQVYLRKAEPSVRATVGHILDRCLGIRGSRQCAAETAKNAEARNKPRKRKAHSR